LKSEADEIEESRVADKRKQEITIQETKEAVAVSTEAAMNDIPIRSLPYAALRS
jgi:hypothetical protein